jgi:hypothetical protein
MATSCLTSIYIPVEVGLILILLEERRPGRWNLEVEEDSDKIAKPADMLVNGTGVEKVHHQISHFSPIAVNPSR